MIISHKYKFIFIKTVKTAGTSIEVFLSQLCDEFDVATPIWPAVDQHRARNHRGTWNPLAEIIGNENPHGAFGTLKDLSKQKKYYNHMTASVAKSRIKKNTWDTYFKFCVDRNPWDKTLSHYHMVNDRVGGNLSIDEYMDTGHFCLNIPKYTDSKGRLLVDKVIRYESLIDDLNGVFENLGIPFDGSLGVRAKSQHRKDRRPYQEVFSDRHQKIIEKAFEKEITLLGYTF